MPELKKAKPDKNTPDLIRQIAKEWQEGKNVDQKIYNQNAEKDKKRFKKQLKEFKKYGYYTKAKGGEESETENEEEEKKSRSKKRSTSKASSQKTKKNRSSSKSKTQKEKGRSRSKSKKSEKVGTRPSPCPGT